MVLKPTITKIGGKVMGLTIFHHDVKNYDKWMDQVSDFVTDSDCFEEFIFRSIEAKNKTYKALNDEDAKSEASALWNEYWTYY